MANKVICNEHGMQAGTLACRHVRGAVAKTNEPVRYRKVIADAFGDGFLLVPSWLCSECLETFGIDPDKTLVIEESEWESQVSERLPDVAPVCVHCLSDYEKVHRV